MIKITIDTENAAFEADEIAEVARILRAVAAEIEISCECAWCRPVVLVLRDVNGNRVGQLERTK